MGARQEHACRRRAAPPESPNTKSENDRIPCLNRCIDTAYLDLCRTLTFTKPAQEFSKEDVIRLLKEGFRNKTVPGCIKRQIDCLFKTEKKNFEEWHKVTCESIIEEAEACAKSDYNLFEEGSFTLGQAQKWLDMTLKHMLIMGIWNQELERYASKLHVPLDNVILGKAFSELKLHDEIVEVSGQHKTKVGDASYTWSRLPASQKGRIAYENLQKKIAAIAAKKGGYTTAIEWECAAWAGSVRK